MTTGPAQFAVFRGATHPARPAAGHWPCVELLPGGDRLPPERLDAWYAVRRTFRWRGEPFELTGRTATTVSGHYLGGDREFAERHLGRRITGHRGTFPLAEATDPEEHREDLLGPLLALLRRLAEADHYRPATRTAPGGRYRVHWTFRWQGGPFEALGTVEGRIKGVYTGGSQGFADAHQLDREPAPDGTHARHTATVDLDAVTDLTRHRTDLP